MSIEKKRIAWFASGTPLTKGHHFSHLLIPSLQDQFEIVWYIDSLKENSILTSIEAYDYSLALRHHREKPFDLFLYNVERAEQAQFPRLHLGLYPGVSVFHDGDLPLDKPWIHWSAWEAIAEALYRDGNKVIGSKNAPDLSEATRGREVELSIGAFFTSSFLRSWYLSKVTTRKPTFNHYVIPYPEQSHKKCLPKAAPKLAVRTQFGSEYRNKELLTSLPTDVEIVVNVRNEGDRNNLTSLADILGVNLTNIKMVTEKELSWEECVKDSWAAIHLKVSFGDSLEPYLSVSRSFGVPCIISDFGESSDYSDLSVIKISRGLSESKELRTAINRLLFKDPIRLTPSSERNLKNAAREYGIGLKECIEYSRKVYSIFNEVIVESKQSLYSKNSSFMGAFDSIVNEVLE